MHLMEKGLEDLHKQAEASGCTTEQKKEAGEEQQLVLIIRDPRSDSSWDEPKVSSKPRRKVLKKKKQKSTANRQSPRSMSMPENVTEEVIFDLEVTGSSDEDEIQKTAYGARSSSSPDFKDMDMLQGTTSYRRINSFGSGSFVTPFSEPETSPVGRLALKNI